MEVGMFEPATVRWFEHGRDFDQLTAIDTKSDEEYWTLDDFKKRLRQKAITCLIAERGGVVVGFLIYELFLHRFAVLRIGVLPKHRKTGVGATLLNELKAKLTQKRTLISAEVRESNLPIQLFLKAEGYRAVEVIRGYYSDTEEDCFVFHYLSQVEG
jgi:ribosomal-protein-alanine N-acetyltransferase